MSFTIGRAQAGGAVQPRQHGPPARPRAKSPRAACRDGLAGGLKPLRQHHSADVGLLRGSTRWSSTCRTSRHALLHLSTTMAYAMEAAGARQGRLLRARPPAPDQRLDRAGAVLRSRPSYRSSPTFRCRLRHGITPRRAARLFNAEKQLAPPARITMRPLPGARCCFDQTGFPGAALAQPAASSSRRSSIPAWDDRGCQCRVGWRR